MRSENSTASSSVERRRADLTTRKLQSAITNGSQLLDDLDHRSSWARRLRDLIAAICSDLGGAANISEGKKVLVRRAAMLTLQCELMEQEFALNEGGAATSKQIETYQRTSNSLRRLLESLGLERRAVAVNPRPTRPIDWDYEVRKARAYVASRGYADYKPELHSPPGDGEPGAVDAEPLASAVPDSPAEGP